jgi:hypothetical protein
MKRIVLAGLLGGLVVFFWGAASHMALPLGEIGLRKPDAPVQQAALAALRDNLGVEGVYLLPMMSDAQWADPEQAAAFSREAGRMPFAFVVFQPQGVDTMAQFPMLLGRQAVSDILGALVAAWIVSLMAVSLLRRALAVAGMGVFAWLAISLPYWNWYRFPLDFTLATLATQAIGWLLGGLVIAWALAPRPR